MNLKPHRSPAFGIGCAAFLSLTCLAASLAVGQETKDASRARAAGPNDAGLVLVFPTGDRATGALLVEVAGPAEVPVGRTYEYRIKATNISKGLALEDVTIHQTKTEGFSIEKSDPKFGKGEGSGDGEASWDLSRLAPGDSKLITVTAQSDKEGMGAGCLRADYKPALCLTTRFVKPDLKVTKQAPEKADLCDVLTYRYTVENTGSGVARGVKVRDELPEGLTAQDGRKSLEFDAGDLEPGRSREFAAVIQAAKTGDFASRAVAEGANDLEARSNNPSTAIRRAELAVRITGPDVMYVNQPMTYRVEVKNEGEAAARGAHLRVVADQMAKLIRTSKADPGGAAPQVKGNELDWDLGTVEPGQAVDVSMTIVGRQEVDLKHTATATSACERGGDIAKAATATETAQTRIMTFPALLLQLVDRTDPVRVGETEVYRVTVVNQGSGADKDVKVTCTLPDQFEYVGAYGAEPAKVDGRTVTLGPVGRLTPHERAAWDLEVKPVKPGDVRMRVELTSDYLSEGRPAISIEPTRIIGSVDQDPGDGRSGEKQDAGDAKGAGDASAKPSPSVEANAGGEGERPAKAPGEGRPQTNESDQGDARTKPGEKGGSSGDRPEPRASNKPSADEKSS